MRDGTSSSPQVGNAWQPLAPLNEPVIDIHPDWEARLYGTREQLMADGMIPKGARWPDGIERYDWAAGGCSYSLHRSRPDGHKGRVKCWDAIDYWCLSWHVTGRRNEAWAAHHRLTRMENELAATRHSLSLEGRRQEAQRSRRYYAARGDKAFQRFLLRVPALVPAPKRPRTVRESASDSDAKGLDHV